MEFQVLIAKLIALIVAFFTGKRAQQSTETESFNEAAQRINAAETAAPNSRDALVERLRKPGIGL